MHKFIYYAFAFGFGFIGCAIAYLTAVCLMQGEWLGAGLFAACGSISFYFMIDAIAHSTEV